jgi:hypothetical protein
MAAISLQEMWEAYERSVLGGPIEHFTAPATARQQRWQQRRATARQQRWQQRRAFYQGAYMVIHAISASTIDRAQGPSAEHQVVDVSKVMLDYEGEYLRFVEDMKAGRA